MNALDKIEETMKQSIIATLLVGFVLGVVTAGLISLNKTHLLEKEMCTIWNEHTQRWNGYMKDSAECKLPASVWEQK